MAQPIICLKDVRLTLSSRAGPVEILRSVSLEVARGHVIHRHDGLDGRARRLFVRTGELLPDDDADLSLELDLFRRRLEPNGLSIIDE